MYTNKNSNFCCTCQHVQREQPCGFDNSKQHSECMVIEFWKKSTMFKTKVDLDLLSFNEHNHINYNKNQCQIHNYMYAPFTQNWMYRQKVGFQYTKVTRDFIPCTCIGINYRVCIISHLCLSLIFNLNNSLWRKAIKKTIVIFLQTL